MIDPKTTKAMSSAKEQRDKLQPKPATKTRGAPAPKTGGGLLDSHVATTLVLIYAFVGAALVVLSAVTHVDPKLTLSFHDYLTQMAVAAGGLAIGRGLAARKP